jgi:hypothetical protein
MEILSYVLEGALKHEDSVGTTSVIRPGDVQRMTAGTGVRHSEFNASDREVVHFLQIWLLPSRQGLDPGYEQKTFGDDQKRGRLLLVASPDGTDGSVTIHSDAYVYASVIEAGSRVEHPLAPGRHVWLQVLRGTVNVGTAKLEAGDGASTRDVGRMAIEGAEAAEILLFDLG